MSFITRSPLGFALILVLATVLVTPLAAGPVNINVADAATLARELKGIGLKRAQAIVDYRSKHGPFRSADELALVKGIGSKAIENNRADIRVEARGVSVKPLPGSTERQKAPTP